MEGCTTLEVAALVLGWQRIEKDDPDYVGFECCGQEVQYKSGIMGPDYACCPTCGRELRMMLSPHVNGGYFIEAEEGDKAVWLAVVPRAVSDGQRDT